MYQASEQENQLKAAKSDVQELVKEHFKSVYDLLISDEKMLAAFAPQLRGFEITLNELKNGAESLMQAQKKVESIEGRLQTLV